MSKSLNLYAGTAVGIALLLTASVNFADRNIAGFPENPPTMAALPAPEPASSGLLVGAAEAATADADGKFGLGRAALPEEVAAWNVDVSPDGTGLPEGSGDVWTGESVFEENCASCHGSFAEGVGNWPKLAGGDGTLDHDDPLKTVGSYWPYLSTVWDYVHRSMPFGAAQTLTPDEVYAITAYILYSNDLVDDDFELSNENFAEFEMPNADGFIVDDRAETEYTQWRSEPCMENCKESVEITMRATVLDVTPDEGGAEGSEEAAAPAEETTTEVAAVAEEAAPAAEEAPAEEMAAAAPIDEALAAEGEKVFRKCKACHQVGDGAKNRTGPVLNGVVGRPVAAVEDFKYSRSMAEHGGTWDNETLHAYLADPRGYVKGTKMAFAGLKKPEDIDAVVEYLRSFQ
ncbi:c-type cytochrome [Salipiger abyssi]|uniref:c-type cytochrome n=1 Tax=Salipiger abyssi TaxID=1250539 RepID=UPI00405A3559